MKPFNQINSMKNLLFFVLASLAIMSCQPDNNPPAPTGSMTLTLDSVSHSITAFNNTLYKEVQFGEAGRRLDIRVNVDGGTLVISVSNWDWQMPPENGILLKTYDTGDLGNDSTLVGPNTQCKSGSFADYCDAGMGTFIIGNQQFSSEFVEGIPGWISITNNDATNLTVSGLFEFTAVDLFTEEEKTFKGNFLNLPYTVLN